MRKKRINRTKAIWTYILVGTFFSSCLLIIFFGHRYQQNLGIVGIFGLFISAFVLQMMWFEVKIGSRWFKLVNTAVLLSILVPTGFIVYVLHRMYNEKQLSDHGIVTYGRVIELYDTKGSKGGVHHHALFQYTLNGETWTQSVNNDDSLYHEQDSLKIFCSSEEPEIYRVESVE